MAALSNQSTLEVQSDGRELSRQSLPTRAPVLKCRYEQLPYWQLCRDVGMPCFSASLHQAHFGFPDLSHAHAMGLPFFLLQRSSW